MIHSSTFDIGGEPHTFHPEMRYNTDLLLALQFWPACLARSLLRLGVFFRAAAIMLQVPGGTRFEFVLKGGNDDEIGEWVWGELRRTLLDVFGECLNRLKASPEILKQLPGGKEYECQELSDKWTDFLDSQAAVKDGLLNVVAEILDELIVRPGMEEIDVVPEPAWWQTWWERIRDAPP